MASVVGSTNVAASDPGPTMPFRALNLLLTTVLAERRSSTRMNSENRGVLPRGSPGTGRVVMSSQPASLGGGQAARKTRPLVSGCTQFRSTVSVNSAVVSIRKTAMWFSPAGGVRYVGKVVPQGDTVAPGARSVRIMVVFPPETTLV